MFEQSVNMLRSKKQNLMEYMFKQLCYYLENVFDLCLEVVMVVMGEYGYIRFDWLSCSGVFFDSCN